MLFFSQLFLEIIDTPNRHGVDICEDGKVITGKISHHDRPECSLEDGCATGLHLYDTGEHILHDLSDDFHPATVTGVCCGII